MNDGKDEAGLDEVLRSLADDPGRLELTSFYSDGAPAWVAPDLWIAAPSRAVSQRGSYRVEIVVDRIGESVGVTGLTVTSSEDERIDSDALRAIHLRALFTAATLSVINWSPNGVFDRRNIASVLNDLRSDAQPTSEGRYRLPEGDALRGLVAVVRAARLMGAGPAALLRDQLGLPSTTARYWVERIKTHGDQP
ncbi:hypothetical protein AAIB33_16360 [Microbacterium sp. AZCO]|uniref:hypothetical protein n=1 Tax=Microbacterium sp. AZCO TaxID=3142976 RepID=UPI0031F460B1